MQNCDSYVSRIRRLVGNERLAIPGARAVIQAKDGRILLQERRDFALWGLPGGSVEDGESIVEVIKRELFEETGLRIQNPIAFGFGSDPRTECITFPSGAVAHFYALNFFCDDYYGEVKPNHESLSLAWFEPTELPDMLPNMRGSVEAFIRFTQTREFQLF